jgi:hypothetical protein
MSVDPDLGSPTMKMGDRFGDPNPRRKAKNSCVQMAARSRANLNRGHSDTRVRDQNL